MKPAFGAALPRTARQAVTLTGEPAGTVAPRAAGRVDLRAVLEWEEAPARPPSCMPAPDGSLRHDLRETLSPCGTRLEVGGSVRALTGRGLGLALERAMRRVADAAAVSGAVLEMRAVREVPPRRARPDLVQALALDLWLAGFGVRFAPCWDPVGPDGLALGAGGEEEGLRQFLQDHPRWSAS